MVWLIRKGVDLDLVRSCAFKYRYILHAVRDRCRINSGGRHHN
jgi:hypothetical protein